MENSKSNIKKNNNEEREGHNSRCTDCPAYNECMGIWLNYFTGKGFYE